MSSELITNLCEEIGFYGATAANSGELAPHANLLKAMRDIEAALQELRAENERLVALLRRAPKFARDVYVGDDKVSWGKQAAALVKAHDTARASITKEKKE